MKVKEKSSTRSQSTLTSWCDIKAGPTPGIQWWSGEEGSSCNCYLPVLRPEKTAVIGNGVVLDVEALVQEAKTLEEAGCKVLDRLVISDRAHLILPYHRAYELAAEQARGPARIGTTAKGIGPSYEDKAGRRGLRACDLRDSAQFRRKCAELLEQKNAVASALFGCAPLEVEEFLERYLTAASYILPCLANVSAFLNAEMDRGKRVLFEGAQGTLLDVDHGTYPFVTSSSAAAGGACIGTGVGPTRIGAVIGVSKAYATRVGSGPFPTEATGSHGQTLRERGNEYGAVTGRPRRCGWFDVPAARYSAQLNHLSALVITKLDILDHLAEIPVGVAYEFKGERFSEFPAEVATLEGVRVHYRYLPGWQQSTHGLRHFSQLPVRARDYLRFLSDQLGVELAMVSTGPQRGETIWLEDTTLGKWMISSPQPHGG